ncbi:unnamed protein product [Caenorhabditis auriculariae]|uniref:Peptidase M13 C-terminal domain-containing protein n=1 Tax=Caenorhabditis auriculariae TaxID=2777116 RepID=A0A8S1H9E9_9PELO|nr:unnamed protein product [Caenorhabditis auriculariae]
MRCLLAPDPRPRGSDVKEQVTLCGLTVPRLLILVPVFGFLCSRYGVCFNRMALTILTTFLPIPIVLPVTWPNRVTIKRMWGVVVATTAAVLLVGSATAKPRVPFVNDAATVKPDVSRTPGFEKAAALLKSAMNTSLDPCDDFYQYACSSWVAANPIPDDLTSYSQFTAAREKVLAEMRELYEEPSIPRSKSIGLVKQIYRACADIERHDSVGAREMLEKIKTFGFWPMVHNEEWHSREFDLTKLLINTINSRDVSVFFDWGPSEDSRDVSRRLINFDQGSLGLGYSTRDYYLDNKKYSKQLKAYRKYTIGKVRYYTQDAGLSVNETKIASDVDEIIDFETRWANVLVAEEDRRNFTAMYNLMHLNDIKELVPILDWDRLFLSTTPFSIHHYVKSNPEIIVSDVKYLKSMTKLLQETEPRIIANYVMLRYAAQWMNEIGTKYEDLQQDFAFEMYGRKQRQPKWKECVGAAGGRLGYASGAMYVRKFFNKEARTSTLDMISDIQEAFKIMMHANDWMDGETKKYALLKAEEMIKQIGYPDFIMNDERLDNWYKGLDGVEGESYSSLNEKTTRWRSDFVYRRLLEPVDRDEFVTSAATVNAFYSPTKNAIAFPAAILQPPFFDASFPKALNYGSIGAVIGHEITHGFDDTGRQFDQIGNLRDWWDNTTTTKFTERAQCIIDQYQSVEIAGTGLSINGKLTQGENIADNGGVKQAFKAYKRYLEKHGAEARLPGLENVTNEQLFFLGYAQVWCGSKTVETKQLLLLTDPHSPETARVNVVLSNQPEFAEAFKCPAGSPMNPTQRCVVW